MLRILCNKFFIAGMLIGVTVTGSLWLVSLSRDFTISNTTCDRPVYSRHSLMNPGHDDAQIIQYAKEAVQAAFTFGDHDVEIRLAHARPYFTCTGFSRFIKLLKRESITDDVIKFRRNISVDFEEGALVESVGYEKSRYSYRWVVRLPSTFKQSVYGEMPKLEKVDFVVTIVRSNEPDIKTPIGINDLSIIRLQKPL